MILFEWQFSLISLIIKKGKKWHLYHGLDVKIEKMSKLMHFFFVHVTSYGTVTFFSLSVLINYFYFDMGINSYEDLFWMCVKKNMVNSRCVRYLIAHRFRVPFDWKTPFGYFLILIMQFITCISTTYPCKATICYLVGSFWAIFAIAEDITTDFHKLKPKRRHFTKNFHKAVEQYTNVKELSGMKSNISSNQLLSKVSTCH